MAEAVILEESGKTHPASAANKDIEPGAKDGTAEADTPETAALARDFHRLMEAFSGEIGLAVPCDGIEYRADDMQQHFVSGVLDHYLCCFELKVGQKSFGNIYFSRSTRFLDSELSVLENMVAGLVLPLCHLFQAEISTEKNRGSDAGEQIPVSDAVCDKQGQGG